MTHPTPAPKSGFRITTEISVGTILQSLIVLAASAGVYVVNASNKTDNTAADLTRVEGSVSNLRSDLIAKMTDTQADNKARFDQLSQQVSGLPDQTAIVHQIDSRVTRLENGRADRDKEMAAISEMLYQDHAMLVSSQDAAKLKALK